VVFTAQDDGITELWALLPADGAALIETVLNSLASAQTDDRNADQRRADALVDAFARVLGDPSLPEQHGRRPAIQVTVQLSTLLGCDEQPAHLDGYGPVTATMARRLASDESGTWRRLVTDDTGQLLDYGRRTYRPPANLTDHVIARDKTCTPSRDADVQLGCAIWITARLGATAARRIAKTSARYAPDTTLPNTKPAGG
jgi:hypothetical protein